MAYLVILYMENHLNVNSNLSVLIFTELEKRLSFSLENLSLKLIWEKKEKFEFYGILKKKSLLKLTFIYFMPIIDIRL